MDHGAVARDDLRITLRDELAEVEHGDAIAHAEHERHVVLDEQHRHAPLVREAADEAAELGGLLRRRGPRQARRAAAPRARRPPRGRARRAVACRTGALRADDRDRLRGRTLGSQPTPRRRGEAGPDARDPSGRPASRGNRRRCAGFRGPSCRRRARGSGTTDPLRPRRALRADHAVTSAPSSSTRPESGLAKPVSASINVDLPAPFGPISPSTSPGRIVSDTSFTASTTPKRTRTASAASACGTIDRSLLCRELGDALAAERQETAEVDAREAVRQPQQHDDDHDAERELDDLVVVEDVAEEIGHHRPGGEGAHRAARPPRTRCRR